MRWFLYRLDWDAQKSKYTKAPCSMDGQHWPVGIPSVAVSDRALVERHLDGLPQQGVACYALGMVPDAGERIFFLDLDKCVTDGQLDAPSGSIVQPFLAAGAYFEGTSSGRGVHVIGRYTGELPAHCNKRPAVHTYEFYTESQGVALNRAHHTGSMDADCTAILGAMLPQWFPPRAGGEADLAYEMDRPRDDWDGPTDDDELLRRALAAKGSAAAAFGGRLTFRQLWEGQCDKNSDTDMALAAHLAFWTGCHALRMERLMRRSGLVREKWNTHRDYLLDRTIGRACSTTRNVYKQVRVVNSDVDLFAVTEEICREIGAACDLRTLTEAVVPKIGAMGLTTVHANRVISELGTRFKLLGAPMLKAQLMAMVHPPRAQSIDDSIVLPEWAEGLCYVTARDRFYDVRDGRTFTADGLRMAYNKHMPIKPNGQREDVVAWCRDRWNVPTVDDLLYRPDQEAFFVEGSMPCGNLFRASTLPAVAEPSDQCRHAITLFQQHLWLMCSQRLDVYTAVFQWLAHNVQKPGHKIRWSPLIKGVPGDGKSIVFDLLTAVMGGSANVKQTGPSTLTNSGGFTDWATGKAVNFIEEIRLVGKEKHRLFNAMKTFIGDTTIDVNRKGRASGDSMRNVTNHWANTNYVDALPVDNLERRWMVVFSPYANIADAVSAKGLHSVAELVAQFAAMGTSMRKEPGAWRAWLLGVDISTFDPDSRAPHTEERDVMAAMSEDPIDSVVQEVLENGGPGITENVFSSSHLRRALKIRAQLEDLSVPSTSAWSSLLSQIGWVRYPKEVKISGTALTIWIRPNFHAGMGEIRQILENSLKI